jgi:hypothetical protein
LDNGKLTLVSLSAPLLPIVAPPPTTTAVPYAPPPGYKLVAEAPPVQAAQAKPEDIARTVAEAVAQSVGQALRPLLEQRAAQAAPQVPAPVAAPPPVQYVAPPGYELVPTPPPGYDLVKQTGAVAAPAPAAPTNGGTPGAFTSVTEAVQGTKKTMAALSDLGAFMGIISPKAGEAADSTAAAEPAATAPLVPVHGAGYDMYFNSKTGEEASGWTNFVLNQANVGKTVGELLDKAGEKLATVLDKLSEAKRLELQKAEALHRAKMQQLNREGEIMQQAMRTRQALGPAAPEPQPEPAPEPFEPPPVPATEPAPPEQGIQRAPTTSLSTLASMFTKFPT